MVDASSTGFGQAKTRSINVEVNLLQDWATERAQMHVDFQKGLVVLVSICAVGFLSIPVMLSWRSAARMSAIIAQKEGAEVKKEVKALDRKVTNLTPSMDFAEMFSRTKRAKKALLYETATILSATPQGVKFDQIKIEAIGGELSFKISASAPDATQSREFVEEAAKGPNVLASNQTSLRERGVGGADGVEFDFTKRVKVSK